jgi:hypothetical protein
LQVLARRDEVCHHLDDRFVAGPGCASPACHLLVILFARSVVAFYTAANLAKKRQTDPQFR